MTQSSTIDTSHIATQQAAASSGRTTLFTGLYTGAALIVVMLGSLVAANRMPSLEPYALERNGVSYAFFIIFMAFPVIRFMGSPLRMFLAGMLGWVLFVAAYDVAGMVFHNLFYVLRMPFEILIEGSLLYGVLAVTCWVMRMCFHARRHPMVPRRRRSDRFFTQQ